MKLNDKHYVIIKNVMNNFICPIRENRYFNLINIIKTKINIKNMLYT
jgi:hypothetical protein